MKMIEIRKGLWVNAEKAKKFSAKLAKKEKNNFIVFKKKVK